MAAMSMNSGTAGDRRMVEPNPGTTGPRGPAPRSFISLWGGLPDFCALVPVVWCLSYAITMLVVGAGIGRQSSTFAIGPFLAIIGAPFLAAAGLVLGKLLTIMLRARVPPRLTRIAKWSAPLVLVAAAVLASRHASAPLYAAEGAARPRVLVNIAQINKSSGGHTAGALQPATRVRDHLGKLYRPLQWDGRSVKLTNAADTLELHFAPAGPSIRIPLPGIDYINYVDAIPLRQGAAGRPVLALLITGRATGRRDLIAMVSPAGELLYLELLDRFWDFRQVPLAIAPTATGDLVLVGSEPQHLLIFAP
jgi:hypothetical protein